MTGLRIRTLKPEFFQSEDVSSLSFGARILYEGLWCAADDHGQGLANIRLIKAAIFPLDDQLSIDDVTLLFKEIEASGMIHIYDVDGKSYYHVPTWNKHQSAAFRRGKPIHPAHACMQEDERAALIRMQESAGTGNEEQGTGNGDADDPEV